jgi:hypothetical protein
MLDCSHYSLRMLCRGRVVVVMVVVGDVVNAGEVVDTGISADVTDVTVRNDRARALRVPIPRGDRGVARVSACFAGKRVRVGERFADTAGPTFKAGCRTHPFIIMCRARVRDFGSHCLLPLSLRFAPCALPHSQRCHLLRHQDRPRLRRRDVELDVVQRVP